MEKVGKASIPDAEDCKYSQSSHTQGEHFVV